MEHGIPGISTLFSSLNSTKYATVASATVLLWDIALTLDLEVYISGVEGKKDFGNISILRESLHATLLFAYDLYSQFLFSPSIIQAPLALGVVCRAAPAPLSASFDCLLVPFFVFETLVFALTLWKSYTSAKVMKLTQSMNIIKVLARDGILYYVVIISISLCNFLIWILDPFASYVAVGLLKSLQATICSRLLLNLRDILAKKAPTMSQFEHDFPGSLINLDVLESSSESQQSQGTSNNGRNGEMRDMRTTPFRSSARASTSQDF
ncbi:hypothetical protein CPB84DRAFT_1851894 [Gymnopilus junonius]|uniref:Uncharacterized protein n=1 Tax=Gymnopilus junonius TaxID=109634 RepID=A0A9P5TIG5_GYMJU|nr:hypothetical protein CPB84DRAFT_1851894 [Gymnopilus junonius]